MFSLGCTAPKSVVSVSTEWSQSRAATTATTESSFLMLGDIMLTKKAAKKVDTMGEHYPFALVKKPFAKYDRIFGNLEVGITTETIPWVKKRHTFRVHPSRAKALKHLNLDVVSLANNHLLDYGPTSMRQTISWLKKHKIAFTGAGENRRQARTPAVIDLKGTKVVILAYNERPPKKFFAKYRRFGTSRSYEPWILKDIKKHKKKGNLVFISMHWGQEHTDLPRGYQVKRCRKLLRAGADAIIGHHPHRPQSIEIYQGKPIIYSLGNFISGFDNPLYIDNIATALYYKGTTFQRMEVLFITGKMGQVGYRPAVVTDPKTVRENFAHLKKISAKFNPKMRLKGHTVVITP